MGTTVMLIIGFLAAAAAIAGAVLLTNAPRSTRYMLGLMGGVLFVLLLWMAAMVRMAGPQIRS